MENEVSGIAKLGIVLIALAVLIGLGFGIFQISKGTANSGVTQVQGELDSVAASTYTTYDQQVITGTMAISAVSDFEGENVAVLIASKAWVKTVGDYSNDLTNAVTNASGMVALYNDKKNVPIVQAFLDDKLEKAYVIENNGNDVNCSFINYNAILGDAGKDATGVTKQMYKDKYYMAGIYFDSNCYRVLTGFATDTSGRVLTNNITGNLNRSGRTEYVPSSAKFDSYLVKDTSGTVMGVAMIQL